VTGGFQVITGDIRDWFDDSVLRLQLETEVLPQYLCKQRWFGGKGRQIERVRVTDAILLQTWSTDVELVFVEVEFTEGEAAAYCLPLTFDGADFDVEDDALAPHVGLALTQLIASDGQLPTRRGRLHGHHTAYLHDETHMTLPARVGGEQSNTSLRFFQGWIMKLIRRLMPGVNPDVEIGRFLLRQPGCRCVPPLVGWIEYHRAAMQPITLAVLQHFVVNEGTAWEHSLHALRLTCNVLSADDSRTGLEQGGASLGTGLGEVLAELHLALASDDSHPAFRPEVLRAEDLKHVQTRIREHLAAVLPRLEQVALDAKEPWSEQAKKVLSHRAELIQRTHLPMIPPEAVRIRCHGDLHLGQVLRTAAGWSIIDFEGEPTRPLAERRAKQSPLKDMAGMVRSFDYAAHALIRESNSLRCPEHEVRSLALKWRDAAVSAFLASYREATAAANLVPPDPHFTSLLNLFLLDKALYELHYELHNRPDWVDIPLRGIIDLVESG
jgi:maltose alpha-D-glucosyltransferase/alpha-amylase